MRRAAVGVFWLGLAVVAASPARAGYAGLPAGAALFLIGFVIVGLALAWTVIVISRLLGMLLRRLRGR